ncbi:MAG: hypothetical protein Ct9H300mP12_12920 [Acidimicrobiales bacterium]|nr:MAG: hypothetical protein Ct9H300mP12_12920 [Acidimicrobiales bacterium]
MGAYASIVEGMSGFTSSSGQRGAPHGQPVGALGDISSALFGTVGVLAALRQRDRTGIGQHVDVAMLDATVAMTDIVVNFFSMGIDASGGAAWELSTHSRLPTVLRAAVRARAPLRRVVPEIGRPELVEDERLATRAGWQDQLDGLLRPAIEAWSANRTPPKWSPYSPVLAWPAGRRRPRARWLPTPTWRSGTCWSRRCQGMPRHRCLGPGNPVNFPRYPRPPIPECRGWASTPMTCWPPNWAWGKLSWPTSERGVIGAGPTRRLRWPVHATWGGGETCLGDRRLTQFSHGAG